MMIVMAAAIPHDDNDHTVMSTMAMRIGMMIIVIFDIHIFGGQDTYILRT